METPTMPPEVVPGQGSTPEPPQATQTPSQEGFQPQVQPTPPVEGGDLQAPSQEVAPRASEFETARQLKRMMKEMQSLKQAFERGQNQNYPQATPPNQPAQVTNEDLVKDPIGALNRLIDAKFRGEIPQHLQQFSQQQRFDQASQEAVRMIKTNSSVKADPEGEARISDILTEEDEFGNSLQKYAETNPRHAAQIALTEYQNRFLNAKRSQSAPTKGQMLSTATAVNAGQPKGNTEQEAKEFYRQIVDRPELMQNPEFLKKYAAFQEKANMEKLARGK